MSLIKFYKNKKILITGSTGFKGSWLNFILNEFGSDVYGYSLSPKNIKDNFNLLKLKNKNNIFADVRDYRKLKKFILRVKPEIIFHLSAQSLVKNSYSEPLKTFSTNIMGVANILKIISEVNFVKSAIIVTSDKCYKNNENKNGYSEKDELGGLDPYSASKASAENVFYSFNNSIFSKKQKVIGLASVRAGNVIGGGDWSEDRIIPDFIKSIIKNNKFFIRSPKAVRPWQHVFDLLNGYLILGKKLYQNPKKFNGSWNFGPNHAKNNSVLDIIKIMTELLKINKKINFKIEKKIKETSYLKLISSKSKKKLGWKPKLNLFKSLYLTADWYNCYINKKMSNC